MKAFSKRIAVILAAASVLTLAGCSNGPVDYRVATTANWNVRTSTNVEKNYLEYWKTHAETAQYKVSFKANDSSTYSVAYNTDTATYSTKFYLEEAYSWQNTAIPEEYRSEEAFTEPVYVYETELLIDGVYKVAGSTEEKAFKDKLISVCKYRLAGENLQPVYSKQTVVNTAPNAINTGDINYAYVETDGVYETYYNRGCSEAKIFHTDNINKDENGENIEEVKTLGFNNKNGYSVFDNSQIRAAARAFTMSGGATRTFLSVSPQNGGVQSCSAAISSPVQLNVDDAEQKAIIDALDACKPDDYIFFDGTPAEPKEGEEAALPRTYRYNAVSLYINSSMTGPAASCWYSTVENTDINGTRCVLLRMTNDLAFGLGTLTYTLKSIKVEAI